MSVYVVNNDDVLETKSDHDDAVPSADISILYPEIAAPPSSSGAVHDRLMVVVPVGVAVRDEGASATVGELVVALATLEAVLVPLELMALTL